MILRKRFKAEVVDSWESTKCREPLCKLIAEKAETVSVSQGQKGQEKKHQKRRIREVNTDWTNGT